MHTFQRGDAVLTARTVQRQLAALLPESRPAGAGDSTLEIAGQGMDAPRLISATMLEDGPQRRRIVPGAPTPGFRAFLDGIQRSDVDVMPHPLALRDAAIHRVQAHREALEWRLAEQWCRREADPLFIDGGISGSKAVAVSLATVGVVKSHRTIYADGEALTAVLSLGHRQRSSVFRISSPKRTTVASWYLRLRDPDGHDPMWGLIRVESAHPSADAVSGIGDRADEVSRWILAESSPLALPDARWDKMVYGIRDCEEFLRATR